MRNNGPRRCVPTCNAGQLSTETSEGDIPHLPVTLADGTKFYAPVLLSRTGMKRVRGHAFGPVAPMRDGEKLVYALPGGLRVSA